MEKRFWKTIISVELAVCMAVGLTACNSKKQEQTEGVTSALVQETTAGTSAQTEIRFTWWGDTKRHEVYNSICDRFEAKNPDIKVIREFGSFQDYWDKLATQVAGGNAPDAFGMHPQYVSDYAGRNALADMQSYIDDGVIDISKMEPSVVDSGRVNDSLCMISQGVTFTNLIANKTMLDKYGISYPAYNDDWTWAEFAEQAKAFAQKADEAGEEAYMVNDFSSLFSAYRYMARQDGTDQYTADGEIAFTEDSVANWFKYWTDLRDANAIPDGAMTTEDFGAPLEQKLFTQGKVAICKQPANQLHLYQAQMPDSELICLRNPTGNNGERGEYIEGAHFAISASSGEEKKLAAAKLINFFVNTEDSMELFKMEQGVPANGEMAAYIKGFLDDVLKLEIEYVEETMKVAGEGTYAPIGAKSVDTAFRDAHASVAFGEMSPEEAAAAFIKEAQDIVAKNKK